MIDIQTIQTIENLIKKTIVSNSFYYIIFGENFNQNIIISDSVKMKCIHKNFNKNVKISKYIKVIRCYY